MEWETLSTNWGEKESEALLSAIVDHYLTVRGYAYASNWMEKYKNRTKAKVQKSHGLRKNLLSSGFDATITSSEDHA